MVSPTPVLIPAGRYVGTTITPMQLALPYMYGEDCGPMWTRKEWKAVHPDAAKVAKQKEEDMLRKAKLRALYDRPYSRVTSDQTPAPTGDNAYPAEARNQQETPKPTFQSREVMMEQPPSPGGANGNGNGNEDDMPPAGIVKKTAPAPTVFWTDHLRMI